MKHLFYTFLFLFLLTAAKANPGLNFSYYEGSWSMLPDFNALTPIKQGVSTNASLDSRNRDQQFGFVWKGFITIATTGTYTFETISDDGSKLYIGEYGYGITPLVNNDGSHASRSRSASITLTAGIHPIAITFFEGDGGEIMEVYWSSNTGIARQIIPNSAFNTENTASGLNFSYYEGSWSTLPDFNALTPIKQGAASNIDLSVRNRDQQFAFLWEGSITIPTTGTYTFETVSDDGSKLYIGEYGHNITPLVNNDGLHASQSRTASVNLAAGVHPIAISFFENDGGEQMEVYWSSNTGISRQQIPGTAFVAASPKGLNFNYYEGSWSSLPDFSTLTPVKQGASANIELSKRNRDLQFAFLWKGSITIPESGSYTFETVSDDGSKFYIGEYGYSTTPLVNNDGLHASQSRSASITLAAGVHPIAVSFFENNGGEKMEVYWSSNTGIARQLIPDNAFTGDTTESLPPTTTDDLRGSVNYYFSSVSGNDSYSSLQAQNSTTPWKTLSKLNAVFSTLKAGEAVLFKRGEKFDGAINITKSGNSGLPIIFSAYGTGAKPVISGLVTLSAWTSLGNNIWEASCPSANSVNMVTINGIVQAMGRYPNITDPNRGYLSLDSYVSNRSITDQQLAGSPSWTGAEVVIRKNNWVLDRCYINSHAGNTLNYNSTTGHEPALGNGYFLQNSPLTLDQNGEWFFNTAQQKLRIYSTTNPSTLAIKASAVDNLVSMDNKSNITFDHISLHGGDQNAIHIQSSQNIRLQYLDINFSGIQGISGENSDNLVIDSNSFDNSNNDAIEFYNTSNTTLKNNKIDNSGLLPGMGQSNNQQHEGIFLEGPNNLIEGNFVENTGYSAITFAGEGAIVRNNYIDRFCLTVEDGGGIYGWGDLDKYNRKVTGNIILNGIGAFEGTTYSFSTGANGIMMDDRSAHVEFSNNTIANCSRAGIFLHNAKDMVIKDNTVFNNKTAQFSFAQDGIAPDVPIRNISTSGNILFSKAATQFILETGSLNNDVAAIGTMNNNYYSRPADENGIIVTSYPDASGQTVSANYDLAGWRQKYGYDMNSHITPVKIPSYVINRYNGSNRFFNSGFNSNTNGAFCTAAPGRCTASWNSGGKLDGGSYQVTFDEASGATNDVGTYVVVGNVEAGKHYIIKFSLLGGKSGKTMKGFLLQDGKSYARLSEIKYLELTTTRTEQQILFSPTVSESVLLALEMKGMDCPYWMDNFEVLEADITMTDPNDFIRFEYNASFTNKTVSLDGNYTDVKSNIYNGSITLAPFTSAVLIKVLAQSAINTVNNTNAEADISLSVASSMDVKVTPNPATNNIHILVNTPAQAKQSTIAIRSITGATMKTMPAGSTGKAVSVDVSTWPGGTYLVTLNTDGHITTKQFVKK